jgi:sporulation protein YlmC with PRC-barrel domain
VTDPLLLSECLRLPVRDASGATVGRVADLRVAASERHPRVLALLVRRRGEPVVVPWSSVEWVGPRDVVVRPPAPTTPALADDGPALLLGRDVLDAQVVDLEGRRLARVGDAELAERDGRLCAVSVDVGLAPVLRRLGLRRLARRLREEWIDWDGIYLASGRGHRLQVEHRAADIHRLDHEQLMALVGHLPPARGAEVLNVARPGKHSDPVATARRARRSRRRFPVMRARKRAPS